MSGIDIASRKWKYAHATLKDKSHIFGRQSKPCWDGNFVDSKIMKYRHYHRWSLNVFDINLQNALIFRRHWKLISTLMPHAISIVQAAWGKGGWWIWSICAPQLGDPLQHRKCRNFQGLSGFLLSKIHAHSTAKCGEINSGPFFHADQKHQPTFPKLLEQYRPNNLQLRLFFCRIFGNKMTWGQKTRLFSLRKMHNTVICQNWVTFIVAMVVCFESWNRILGSSCAAWGPSLWAMRSHPPVTIKPPIYLDTQHFFLVDCVDIFSQYPRAERVITRPEIRNHDHNFTHKDPNCCHKFCTFSSQQIFSETSFTSKKAFFQEKFKALIIQNVRR